MCTRHVTCCVFLTVLSELIQIINSRLGILFINIITNNWLLIIKWSVHYLLCVSQGASPSSSWSFRLILKPTTLLQPGSTAWWTAPPCSVVSTTTVILQQHYSHLTTMLSSTTVILQQHLQSYYKLALPCGSVVTVLSLWIPQKAVYSHCF